MPLDKIVVFWSKNGFFGVFWSRQERFGEKRKKEKKEGKSVALGGIFFIFFGKNENFSAKIFIFEKF